MAKGQFWSHEHGAPVVVYVFTVLDNTASDRSVLGYEVRVVVYGSFPRTEIVAFERTMSGAKRVAAALRKRLKQ